MTQIAMLLNRLRGDLLCATVITARKRSLGQGNKFTGVCLSTGGVPDQVTSGQTPPRADTPLGLSTPPRTKYTPGTKYTPQGLSTPPRTNTPPRTKYTPPGYGQRAGGMHPTGMQTCFFCIYQFAAWGQMATKCMMIFLHLNIDDCVCTKQQLF